MLRSGEAQQVMGFIGIAIGVFAKKGCAISGRAAQHHDGITHHLTSWEGQARILARLLAA
jgi:hypothetical protein